jgi:hypothetical protein
MTAKSNLVYEPYTLSGQADDGLASCTSVSRSTPPGGSWTSGTTYNALISRSKWIANGVRIRGFRRARSSGILLPYLPYSRLTYNFEGGLDEWYRAKTTGGVLSECDQQPAGVSASGSEYTAHFLNFENLSGLFSVTLGEQITDLRDRAKAALQRASSDVVENQRHDLLTFVAEIAKVKKMFEKLLVRVLTLDFPRNVGSLANSWLEYRYGWRPLIYDAEAIGVALAKLHIGEKKTRHFGVAIGPTVEYEQTYNTSAAVSASACTATGLSLTYSSKDSWKGETIGRVAADLYMPPFRLNPIATAWELVPFSFVIDWFLQVGNAINSAMLVLADHEMTSSIGIKATLTHEVTFGVGTVPSGTVARRNIVSTATCTYVERLPTQIPFLPTLTGKSLGIEKTLDLLSLVIQRMFR